MGKIFMITVACWFGVLPPAWAQQRYDVVITEIMADPSPVVGLPNAEYVEIKNVSASPVQLQGWKLADLSSSGTIASSFLLQPDSLVILCANSQVAVLSALGKTIGVNSFPSLDNEGDQLALRAADGRTIHAVAYTVAWYQNAVKQEGGWSLEMTDPKNPCGGMGNWKASLAMAGGTPGAKNSVDGILTDDQPPRLIRTYTIDSITLVAVFNEPVDSTSAVPAGHYSISHGLTVLAAGPQPPLFQQVVLKLNTPMKYQTVYELTVTGVADCKGHPIQASNQAKAGRPESASKNDVVVNEILFNPRPNGNDYVELYNRSNKILDASALFVANRAVSGQMGSPKKISLSPFLVFPGEYLVVTEQLLSLQQQYFVSRPETVLELASMPSFPDDEGTVVITGMQGDVLDELRYSEKWHFALIENAEGVALERIDPSGLTQHGHNWHSAASTAGFGTPGYKNSQYRESMTFPGSLEVHPKIFSPDNDGYEDWAAISYQLSENGYVANLLIFDAAGRPVRNLVRNALLSTKGNWNWDGTDDKGNRLPVGTYIIHAELFNLQGKKKQFRLTVVLARRLD